MLFTQFVDNDLGCCSYLVGCEGAGEAVLVDPAYAIEQYLEEAQYRGVRIVRVIETHTHADHVSGHGRLALDHGIPVTTHPLAGATHPHDEWEDGDEIVVGNVALRCLHTPGHRPEHCCVVVVDRTRTDEPWLVLTGDSLFVGDVARPDLAVGAVEGAEGLFHSMEELLELADGVEVFPGHVAGSLCGTGMSAKASTTIGFERRFNPMLAYDDVSSFVAASAAIETPKPPNLERIVALNRGAFVPSPAPLAALPGPPDDAQLLDVRPFADYAAGHVPGALSVPVSGSSFATKAGFLLDPEQPVCVLAAGEDEACRAARGLRSVGFLDVAGWAEGHGEAMLATADVTQVEALLAAGAVLVDVRDADERERAPLPGSTGIPFHQLAARLTELDRDCTIVTVCETGPRAAVAASVLAAHGFDARPVVDGGTANWPARLSGAAA